MARQIFLIEMASILKTHKTIFCTYGICYIVRSYYLITSKLYSFKDYFSNINIRIIFKTLV